MKIDYFIRNVFILIFICISLCFINVSAQDIKHIEQNWSGIYIKQVSRIKDNKLLLQKYSNDRKKYYKFNKLNTIADFYLHLCNDLQKRGQYVSSLLISKAINSDYEKYVKSDADYAVNAELYNVIGLCYTKLGLDEKAMESLNKALKILNKHNSLKSLALTYNNLQYLYYKKRMYKNSCNLLNKALEINLKIHAPGVSLNYNNLGIIYTLQKKYSKAMWCFNKALIYVDNETFSKSSIYNNIGELYKEQKKYKEAENILTKAVAVRGREFNVDMINTELGLVEIKILNGKNGEARNLLNMIKDETAELPSSDAKATLMKYIASDYFTLKDSLQGAKVINQYITLADSIKEADNNNQLQLLLVEYDVERMQNENLQLRHTSDVYKIKSRNRMIFAVSVIIFSFFLAAIVALLIIKNRSDKKKNSLIRKQKDKLLEYEQREFERKKNEMEETISKKNRELTTYAIDLSAISQFHDSIAKRLKSLFGDDAAKTKEKQTEFHSLIFDLEHNTEKQVSEDFRKYFNEVRPDFFDILRQKHPNLTENDLHICAFLFLGLSTKEIAALTSHGKLAIDKSRQRLHKRLNLESNSSICEYLRTLYNKKQ